MHKVVAHKFIDAQRAWNSIDKCQHVGTKIVLKLSVLVEVVEYYFGDSVFLENDNKALSKAFIAFVTHI
ncbi:unannotated protein [freshwater metagenome]|uniref:Unannotated protein n=1 Tax=freshwater metagenome TaxID=449393 RepID=A0A6J7S9F4_9ZZZZ